MFAFITISAHYKFHGARTYNVSVYLHAYIIEIRTIYNDIQGILKFFSEDSHVRISFINYAECMVNF